MLAWSHRVPNVFLKIARRFQGSLSLQKGDPSSKQSGSPQKELDNWAGSEFVHRNGARCFCFRHAWSCSMSKPAITNYNFVDKAFACSSIWEIKDPKR